MDMYRRSAARKSFRLVQRNRRDNFTNRGPSMDLPINHFKHAIADGKKPVGAWLVSAAPSAAEALGYIGFDFLVVDMEHTPLDTPQMIGILQTIAGTPAQAIVRPPWNDIVMVKRALDAGAQSLLFPFVQNAEEAKRAVASTRYPPAGVRGVAAMHRGSRYGTVPNYQKRAHEEVCVIVQIETLTAFDQLEAIAAVPGVDSIFIGPADLSASMGFLGDMGNAAVQEQLRAGAQACKRLGKPCGIVGANPEIVASFLDYGFSWVAVGSDLAMLASRATEYLGAVRKSIATAQRS